MAKHTSKCLHWSAAPMPAASCAQLPFGGVSLLSMSKISPQMFGDQIWNSSLEFHHPPHNFGLRLQVRKPPFQTLRFPMNMCTHTPHVLTHTHSLCLSSSLSHTNTHSQTPTHTPIHPHTRPRPRPHTYTYTHTIIHTLTHTYTLVQQTPGINRGCIFCKDWCYFQESRGFHAFSWNFRSFGRSWRRLNHQSFGRSRSRR